MNQPIIDELVSASSTQSQQIPADQTLFSLGDQCSHYVIVQSGVVRVELLSKSGQQLLLYRIREGESCVMTTSCLLSNSEYFAQAMTETPVKLMLIPQTVFHSKIMESTAFREFVFNGFAQRLSVLMQRTASLATNSIDQRLAAALMAYKNDENAEWVISLTHEQLAVEIGSAREVVSRRLAAFEKNGIIERHRGHITVDDIEKLTLMLAE